MKQESMKAQDFRIGNLVDRVDYICTVESISKDGIMTEPLHNEGERFVEQELKPIPLTEEWLVKFGMSDYEIHGFEVDVLSECIEFWVVTKYSDYSYSVKLQYVHQLQNAYFALTGEELPLQNKKA